VVFSYKKATGGSIYVKVVGHMRRCKEELQPPFEVAMPFYNYYYRHVLLVFWTPFVYHKGWSVL